MFFDQKNGNNTMTEVRIAIVGMGIGRPNAMALDANQRGRVVALCDLDESRMDELAKNLKSPVTNYTDYKAVCQAVDVDAVFVGTPNQWHVPVGGGWGRGSKKLRQISQSAAFAGDRVDVE